MLRPLTVSARHVPRLVRTYATKPSVATSADSTSRVTQVSEKQPGDTKQIVTDEDTRIRSADDAVAAGVVNGDPVEMYHRQVRIYRPTKNAMQSATADTEYWRVDWDRLPGSGAWVNPLMGWSSSADYMQGTKLKFETKEDAISFCEKQGWDYYVQKPNHFRFVPKSYSDNFKHVAGELRLVQTK